MTRCDAQGEFLFSGVAPSTWIVMTRVAWGVPSGYGILPQGGTLIKRVDALPGDNQTILSGADTEERAWGTL